MVRQVSEQVGPPMSRLPIEEWTLEKREEWDFVIVGSHEKDGYRWYTKVKMIDLPDALDDPGFLDELATRQLREAEAQAANVGW
jgi:hypothetical protein